VTATDVAQSALATGARKAAAAGVAAAITWEQHDLGVSFPAGTFDLVTTSFLHSPVELPRTAILRRAAAAVAPGGTLLVIGHAPSATHAHADLPTAEDVVADLALPADEWTVRTARSSSSSMRSRERDDAADGRGGPLRAPRLRHRAHQRSGTRSVPRADVRVGAS
jgi:2-polyprenyl-3-methyl-5-hydroxy-6-metoxy-1,4-benzoquinol methylase